MADLLNNKAKLSKEYGPKCAEKIILRLAQMKSSIHLHEFSKLHPSPRCHELQKRDGKNRVGQFAVDLEGAWRLIFEPCDIPLPLDENNKLIWHQACAVRILSVENYHD